MHPFSLLYDTFFESVVFDDVTTLKSPFLAHLNYSNETDRKIRINVYYSSSLTGGKETIIAATTFGLREMLRSGKASFQSDMISEHCSNTKATLTIATTPTNPFTEAFFTLSPALEKNPMTQQYVFFRGDESVPTVICDEVTYEPLFPIEVPLAFLRQFGSGLQQSILAWEDRCKLERVRQGKFVSIAEAHKYGWHQLRVTVLASTIKLPGDTLSKATAALISAPIDERGVDDGETPHLPPPPPSATMSPGLRQASTNASRTSSTTEEVKSKAACNTFVEVFIDR